VDLETMEPIGSLAQVSEFGDGDLFPGFVGDAEDDSMPLLSAKGAGTGET
jgi:hypothetical protein